MRWEKKEQSAKEEEGEKDSSSTYIWYENYSEGLEIYGKAIEERIKHRNKKGQIHKLVLIY